tara:strand:+ start:537 stop:1205 length:669 start_codon:yes stop_codon:yes gene_type:complete
MKKLLSILTAMIAGMLNLSAQTDSCAYTMDMQDAWGDGWNGANVTVSLDAAATSYEATADPNAGAGALPSDETISFLVSSGSAMEVSFTSGSWDSEITFQIYNNFGTLIYASDASGAGPAVGVLYSSTAGCSWATDVAEVTEDDLTIYPNPNNGEFFISNNGKAENVNLHVLDIQGKEVYNNVLNLGAGANEFIKLNDLNPGMYIVVLDSENGRTTQNVVVQ